MSRVQQLLDQRYHLRNMARGARNNLGSFAAERVGVFPEGIDVLGRVVVDIQTGFLRLSDDAVFNVSDIHHVFDFEAFELQIPTQNVGGDGAAKVSDVTVVPDRWTAVIEADLAVFQGAKLFDAATQCVAKSKHGTTEDKGRNHSPAKAQRKFFKISSSLRLCAF